MGWTKALGAALLGLAAASAAEAAEPLAGHWQGELVREGQSLPISYDFEDKDKGLAGRFTATQWRAMDYPLSEVTSSGGKVHWRMGDSDLFDGEVKGDTIAGAFSGGDGNGTFTLHRAPVERANYDAVEVTFRNGEVTLKGTLCLPRGMGRMPAVVLVHGSGPEVRWGTNRYVADRLARAGIAALIFDKRGSGASGGDWRTASYEDLADDALAAVHMLAARPDIDPRRVGVIGHSQGGIIGPLAAVRGGHDIAFVVAEDTVAGPVWRQDIYRVSGSIKALHLAPADEAKAMEVYRLFIDVARGLKPYEELEAASAPYKQTEWYDWMGLPPKDAWIWAWYRKTGSYDTLPTWRQVKVPTLLVYGERDALVPVGESLSQIEAELDASGAPYAAMIAPRAEHNLTVHPAPGEPFFWWRQAPGVIDLVVDWVKATAG